MLTESSLQSLLDESLRRMGLANDLPVALEGSLAEGFGNATSDIDFIVIDDSEGEAPLRSMPAILFIDGRRVEMRVRSRSDIRLQFDSLQRVTQRGGDRAHLSEELLDQCQRLKRALPLREPDRVRHVQELLPAAVLSNAVSTWFGGRASRAARCAVILLKLARPHEAASWARVAVNLAAKSWAAAHGETYLSPKWITQQLGRIANGQSMLERFLDLDSPSLADHDAEEYVARALSFARDAGLQRIGMHVRRVTVSVPRGVTTWQIGKRVHLVRDRSELYRLTSSAARVWRALSPGTELSSLIARFGKDECAFLADMERIGLLTFTWGGAGRIAARPACGATSTLCRPALSIEGAELTEAEEQGCRAFLVPMPAAKFASAGLALMWSNMMIENALEDAAGALTARQWGTLENTARRVLREACMCILSAFGINPLPHTEEACTSLSDLAEVPRDLCRKVIELSFDLRIRNDQDARERMDSLAPIVQRARELSRSGSFPSCFESANEWRSVLELGYEWTRLGVYVESTFPFDEVRDLLASVSQSRVPSKAVGELTAAEVRRPEASLAVANL